MLAVDVIAICISAVALIVSLLTLYLTYFYQKVSLIGRLVLYNTNSTVDKLCGEYKFSLSNSGNKELLVWEVELDIENKIGYLIPELSIGEIPAVIKAGAILLLRIDIPIIFMRLAASNNVNVIVKFQIVSSDGIAYVLSKEFKPLDIKEDKERHIELSDTLSPFIPFELE